MSAITPRFGSSCCSGGAEKSSAQNAFAVKGKAPVLSPQKMDHVQFGSGEADKLAEKAEEKTMQAKGKFKRYAGPGAAVLGGVAITVLTGGLFHFIGIPIALAGIYFAWKAHKNKFGA